ncbi:MAG: leucine-rich repeat domain-containing protein [Bacteroidales bacterium]|nr:leucine-rich repeat domain-containing protein [Bacteroidales bacterium]
MKKLLFLLLAVCLLSPLVGCSDKGTFRYEVIDESNATCKVIDCDTDKSFGEVVIPEYAIINGKKYRVTEIGESAFFNRSRLTSITIPNSVTSIGELAFMDCENLTSITLPNSVTTIEGGAFYRCKSLTSITLPNSVTTIGRNAFAGCNLTDINIPNSVTSIGEQAFGGCDNLTEITIPNSVTSIGDNLFGLFGCERLNTVKISELMNDEVKNKLIEQINEYNKERRKKGLNRIKLTCI